MQYKPAARGRVVLIVGWSLLTDFVAIKRAGVPIWRSLNIQYRLKQHAREQRDRTPVNALEASATRTPIHLVPQLGDDVDHNPTRKILDWRLMIEDW